MSSPGLVWGCPDWFTSTHAPLFCKSTWDCRHCSNTNVCSSDLSILPELCFHAFPCAHEVCISMLNHSVIGGHRKQQLHSTCRVPVVLTAQLEEVRQLEHLWPHAHTFRQWQLSCDSCLIAINSKMHPDFGDVTLWKKICLRINRRWFFLKFGVNSGDEIYSETLGAGPHPCHPSHRFLLCFLPRGSLSILFQVVQSQCLVLAGSLVSAVRTQGKNKVSPQRLRSQLLMLSCVTPVQLPDLTGAHFPHLQNGNNYAFFLELVCKLNFLKM